MKRGSAQGSLVTKPEDPANPFSMNWLDSCYQETLLPGAPWHQINKDLSDALADFLPRQMSQLERATVLSGILGDGFMAYYYPDVLTALRVGSSDKPHLKDEKKLALEASGWLKSQLLKAAKTVGSLPDGDISALSHSMREFIKLTSQTFYKGLNRQLYKQEIEMTTGESPVTLSLFDNPTADSASVRLGSRQPSPYNHFPYVQPTSAPSQRQTAAMQGDKRRTSPSVPATPQNTMNSIKRERVKASVSDPDVHPIYPVIHSKPIQFISESVVKLLERSPRRFAAVAKRLHGRLLPAKLRTYMWTETLYKAEREKLTHGANVERILREKFGKTVARNVGEMRLVRATQSPIHRLIENSVLEMYDNTPALVSCKNKLMMKEAVKTLNILYTYDKTYEPYLILWLFPLQIAFGERMDSAGPEHVYELAMHLDILNSSLFMQWNQVYAISDLVMYHLSRNDRKLHDHLEKIAEVNVEVTAKDFVIDLMKKERAEAEKMLNKPPPKQEIDSQAMLSNARIYIRKWIGEGFVGVLDTPAVMFVWDQLFLQDWASTVFQDFALVLLLLLRENFLSATDHSEMRAVFLHEPSKLLTADIQKAWLMIHEKANYRDVAKCNRLNEPSEPEPEMIKSPEQVDEIASAPPGTTPQNPVLTPQEQSPEPVSLTPAFSIPRAVTVSPTPLYSTGNTPLGYTPYIRPETTNHSTGLTPAGETPYLRPDTVLNSTGRTPTGETPANNSTGRTPVAETPAKNSTGRTPISETPALP